MKTEIKIALVTLAILGVVVAIVFVGKNKNQGAIAQNSSQCMITLFGQQYDVTNFRKMHQGGDVFICGTDMTKAYQQQHGSDTARIQQFLK